MNSTLTKRCGRCGRNRPVEDTALVFGRAAGNYRRAGSSRKRRVCRDCVASMVDHVRATQRDHRRMPLVHGDINWKDAADAFGIDVTDLYVTDYGYDKQKALAEAAPFVVSTRDAVQTTFDDLMPGDVVYFQAYRHGRVTRVTFDDWNGVSVDFDTHVPTKARRGDAVTRYVRKVEIDARDAAAR